MYLMGSTRCGISAKQIQRETWVTYETAWRIFKQVRSLLSDGDLQLDGPTAEIDETYMGGRRKGQRGRSMRDDKVKTPVEAIVQRGGKVLAKAVPDPTGASILPIICDHVAPESVIHTDEYAVYDATQNMRRSDRSPMGLRHETVNHGAGEYVRGGVHTKLDRRILDTGKNRDSRSLRLWLLCLRCKLNLQFDLKFDWPTDHLTVFLNPRFYGVESLLSYWKSVDSDNQL
jgi:transposase-like protein